MAEGGGRHRLLVVLLDPEAPRRITMTADQELSIAHHFADLTDPCERRPKNGAPGGDRRAVEKRSAHGSSRGGRVRLEGGFTPSLTRRREVYGCSPTWRTGPRSAVASSSTAWASAPPAASTTSTGTRSPRSSSIPSRRAIAGTGPG